MNRPRHFTRLRPFASMVFVIVSLTAEAQEVSWPTPGKEPVFVVGGEYALNAFDKVYAPMHQGVLYGAMRHERGTAFVKLIRASRFGASGLQGEIELYPTFGGGYGYIDYAFGSSPVFPSHRLGLEAFVGLPYGLEASIGGRYYDFRTESVTLASGSVSYYYRNFVFMLRPFVGLDAGRSSFSASMTARYYTGDEEFVYFRVGGGFSPDERWIQSTSGIFGRTITFLQSQTMGGGVQALLSRRVLFVWRLDISRQEVAFTPGAFVIDISSGTGLRFTL